MLSLAIHRWRL